MNPIILLATVVLLVGVDAKPANYERVKRQLPGVPREFQNINIENYLRNARAVQFQLKCVIYDGPCDSIGKYLKRNIPVWLRTQCQNCNDEQKQQAGKLINFFQSSYGKEWDDAVKKYAKGAFTEEEIMRFETELGVNINAPPPAPGAKKPDHNALADLAKESIAVLRATKEPIILAQGGSTTAVTIPASATNNRLSTSATTPKTTEAAPAEESATTNAPA